jgi:hypothetical protein
MKSEWTLVDRAGRATLRLAAVVLAALAPTRMTNAQSSPTIFFTQTGVNVSVNGSAAFQPNTLTSSTTFSQTGESGSGTANLPAGTLGIQSEETS